MEEIPFDIDVLRKKLLVGDLVDLTVVSNSMVPIIKVQDVIQVKKVETKDLKPFDIILFYQGGRLNCHFLTKTDWQNNTFITQSYKNFPSPDFPLKAENIIGIITNKKLNLWHRFKVLLLS